MDPLISIDWTENDVIILHHLGGNLSPKILIKIIICWQTAHIFCRAGNGIAAEHIVAIVFVVNENCPRVFAAQEKELLLNNS